MSDCDVEENCITDSVEVFVVKLNLNGGSGFPFHVDIFAWLEPQATPAEKVIKRRRMTTTRDIEKLGNYYTKTITEI